MGTSIQDLTGSITSSLNQLKGSEFMFTLLWDCWGQLFSNAVIKNCQTSNHICLHGETQFLKSDGSLSRRQPIALISAVFARKRLYTCFMRSAQFSYVLLRPGQGNSAALEVCWHFPELCWPLNWWDDDGIVSSCQTERAGSRADGKITRSFQESLQNVDVLEL